MNLIAYFLAGILQDILFTLNIRFITLRKVVPAVISSFLVTVVSLVVLYDILSGLDQKRSLLAIIIYAAGIGTGTLLGMKLKLERGEKR